MTKPVTGVAILMLMEEGKLRLTDPVSRFIPEFKNMKVAMVKPRARAGARRRCRRRLASPEIYTVPADREITVRDLMTHTSGLESGGAGTREGERIAPRKTNDDAGDIHPAARRRAARFPAGHAVALQRARRHRNARPHRRGRVGADVRSVSQAAHLRSARHEGHGVLSDRRRRRAS